MKRVLGNATLALALATALAAPAAAQFRNKISDDPARCREGAGPAVNVHVSGLTPAKGTLRVQLYRGTESDWLKPGRWLNRIELPVRAVHASGVAKLAPHHTDPFDRLLIAQAMAEPLRFLTADSKLTRYGELIIQV